MKRFIYLQSRIINKSHITQIEIKLNKYCIHLSNSTVNGYFITGSGFVNNDYNVIEICKKMMNMILSI